MTRFICNKTLDPSEGMNYSLSIDALMFLGKINSPLIFRTGKDSDKYEGMLSARNSNFYKYAYNEEGEYFIQNVGIIRGIEWRTHPDLISYIEETDQDEFKIMDVPGGKIFTEFTSENPDYYIVIISDGPITVA
uniref:Uncharacterized protein n=1 Tax=Pithovirus LCPAC406 TaxID=2506599 RepID=A0A481ZDR6_9VIRU|nr:MAG: uncharacterized protein LCPAC406_03620 [Pithovirus LCPAC406]